MYTYKLKITSTGPISIWHYAAAVNVLWFCSFVRSLFLLVFVAVFDVFFFFAESDVFHFAVGNSSYLVRPSSTIEDSQFGRNM
jgi:hypothetical protein